MVLTELKFQDPRTKTYLGSPSIVRATDGALLATHDYFGPACPRNHEDEEHFSSVYRSDDDGKTWHAITHIANAYWSTLFVNNDATFLLGVSQQYGSIVIRKSEDNGFTWTHPQNERCGILFRGGTRHDPPNYHCAPVPVVNIRGRIYKAFEDCTPCVWGSGFQSFVISADENSDLLDACSWVMSNKLPFKPEYLVSGLFSVKVPGWLEGNIVEAPDGRIFNILRFNSEPLCDIAAVMDVSEDGGTQKFCQEKGFISFPGGNSKFTIRRDPETKIYLTLSNRNKRTETPWQRNILSLCGSKDLIKWHAIKDILLDDSGLPAEESIEKIGFQYVDWQFDGDSIIYLSRTAYNGAHTFHDANRITFHRIKNFRQALHVQALL